MDVYQVINWFYFKIRIRPYSRIIKKSNLPSVHVVGRGGMFVALWLLSNFLKHKIIYFSETGSKPYQFAVIPNSFKLCLELFYLRKKTRGGDKKSLQKNQPINTAAPHCLPPQKEAALPAGCKKPVYRTFFHLSTLFFGFSQQSPSSVTASVVPVETFRQARDNFASLLPIESFHYLRFFLFNFLFWNAFFIICETFMKANY